MTGSRPSLSIEAVRFLVGSIVVLVACVPPRRATMEQLAARSSFDLACPPAQMQVYDFGERAKGVAGCGRRLTYVEECAEGSCAWVLDSPAGEQLGWSAPAPPPPPPPAWSPPVQQAPPAAPVATPGPPDWGF